MYRFSGARHFALFIRFKAYEEGKTQKEVYDEYIKSLNLGEYEVTTSGVAFMHNKTDCIGILEDAGETFALYVVEGRPGVVAIRFDRVRLAARLYKDAKIELPLEKAPIDPPIVRELKQHAASQEFNQPGEGNIFRHALSSQLVALHMLKTRGEQRKVEEENA